MPTLTPGEVTSIAGRLEEARMTRVPMPRITLEHPQMTIDDAYACQSAWIELQLEKGCRLGGRKVGLTSRAMQVAANIEEPDFGVLLDYMFFENGSVLVAADYVVPRIEVELAFVLARSLEGPDVTADDVYAATEYITPAVELIDSRMLRSDPGQTAMTRTIKDTIADNAASAGIMVGGARIEPGTVDLRWVGALLRRNGRVEETGLGAGVLDDPAAGVVWLVRKLSDYGVALEPGHTILSGSFTRAIECRPGDTFEVDFHEHGQLSCSFE